MRSASVKFAICGIRVPDHSGHRTVPGALPAMRPKIERVDQLPSKEPVSKRFEDAVGLACEGASARKVARAFRLSESTVRAIDLRYLERWAAARKKPALRQMGVDEIHLERSRSS